MKAMIPLLGLAAVSGATAAQQSVVMKADDMFAARKSAMFLSGALVSTMKMSVESGASVKDQAFAANALARWANVLPALFGGGSDVPGSRASPRIWVERADFESKARDYREAALQLAKAARSGDKATFLTQLESTRGKCSSCHDSYRLKDPITNPRG